MEIAFTKKAAKQLAKLDHAVMQQVAEAIERLTDWPDVSNIKAMQGKEWAGCYRLRVGQWRVIFTIEDDTILILAIDHRRNIYR